MTCAHYMGQSCGIRCCLARAEQFTFYEHNERELAEFCPLVQRYGEKLNRIEVNKTKDQGVQDQRVAGSSKARACRKNRLASKSFCGLASISYGS